MAVRSSILSAWLCLLLAAAAPPAARADCVLAGTDVSCTGSDPDGFDAGGTDGLAVTVAPGATVNNDNLDNTPALDLADDTTVVNDGTISANAPTTGAIGIRIGNDTMSTAPDITNDGLISATSDDAIGIDAGDAIDVENTGTISATGGDAIAVRLGDGDTLTNGGIITGSGMDARGVVVTGGTGSTITNQALGRIRALSDGTTAIEGGPGADVVTNAGTITGDVLLGAGNDTMTLMTGSVVSGDIDGGANTDALRLEGDGGGFLDLDALMGFESLVVGGMDDQGVWSLSGMQAFPGGVDVDFGGIRLGSETMITGDVDFADGTELFVDVNPGVGNGRLTVTGAATLGDTGLTAIPLGLITGDTLLTVLSATGGITGGFTSIPQDTGLLSFSLVPGPNEIQLQILRRSYATFAATSNQAAAARHLDAILQSSPGADMVDVLLELDSLPASQLAAAYDQLHPEAYDAHTGGTASLGRAVARAATRTRMPCRRSILDHGSLRPMDVPCGSQPLSAWIEAMGSSGDRDAGSDFREFDLEGRGIVGGFDWQPDRLWTVTGWVGLAAMDVEGASDEDGTIETFETGMAAILHWAGARARAAFGYGYGDHEQDRIIRFGQTVRSTEAEFTSHRILALFEAGYVLAAAGFELEPLASLETIWVGEEEVSESGGGALDLELDARDNVIFSTTVGTALRYRLLVSPYSDRAPGIFKGIWTPELEVRWRGILAGADREIDARLAGAAGAGDFTADARDSGQGVDVGARIAFQPGGASGSITLGYDGFFGDEGTDHRINGNLHIHF